MMLKNPVKLLHTIATFLWQKLGFGRVWDIYGGCSNEIVDRPNNWQPVAQLSPPFWNTQTRVSTVASTMMAAYGCTGLEDSLVCYST
jgi:hypothetical protein